MLRFGSVIDARGWFNPILGNTMSTGASCAFDLKCHILVFRPDLTDMTSFRTPSPRELSNIFVGDNVL